MNSEIKIECTAKEATVYKKILSKRPDCTWDAVSSNGKFVITIKHQDPMFFYRLGQQVAEQILKIKKL